MKPKLLEEVKHFNKEIRKTSFEIFREVLKRLCETHAASEIHQKALGYIRGRNYEGLLLYADSLGRQSYPSAWEHFQANQLCLLIKKYPFPNGLIPTLDPEGEAVKKFEESEAHCSRMNQTFRGYRNWSPFEFYLDKVRQFVVYTIGQRPDLGRIYDNSNFGPGASIGVHGNATNVARKIGSRWSVSPSAYYHGRSAAKRNAQLFELLCAQGDGRYYAVDSDLFNERFSKRVEVVNHNKIAFVPKTARSDRTIAVEPLLNGFVQKGCDLVMRRMLLRVGINLSDQSINQEMAREGSLSTSEDGFVTIDLSSASDSVSIELCRHVLPHDWFVLLDDLRSKSYSLKGTVRPYEKICSMGNGFCFPLETLLFTAACSAVGCGLPGRDFHVYGDDIVVRKSKAIPVLTLLELMGFNVNSDKTFLSGPFRESCGVDSYEGKDVRPFTLDNAFDSLESLIKFCNLTRRNGYCSSYFGEVPWRLFQGLVPLPLQFVRPFSGPDGTAVEVPVDVFMASPYAKWQKATWSWEWRELLCEARVDKTLLREVQGEDVNISLLWTGLTGGDSNRPFTLRRMTRTRVRKVSHHGGFSTWLPAQREK